MKSKIWDFFYAIALSEATVYLFGIMYIQPTRELIFNPNLSYLAMNGIYSWSYLFLWIFGEEAIMKYTALEMVIRFFVLAYAMVLAWWFVIKAYKERPRKK